MLMIPGKSRTSDMVTTTVATQNTASRTVTGTRALPSPAATVHTAMLLTIPNAGIKSFHAHANPATVTNAKSSLPKLRS